MRKPISKTKRDNVMFINISKFGMLTCEKCFKAPLIPNKPGETRQGPDTLTLDHIKEVRNGGQNELDNLRVLCYYCNSRRARDEDY